LFAALQLAYGSWLIAYGSYVLTICHRLSAICQVRERNEAYGVFFNSLLKRKKRPSLDQARPPPTV
jgi:hypothetical protein